MAAITRPNFSSGPAGPAPPGQSSSWDRCPAFSPSAALTIWRRASTKKPGARSQAWSRLCLSVGAVPSRRGECGRLYNPWPLVVQDTISRLYVVLKIREALAGPRAQSPLVVIRPRPRRPRQLLRLTGLMRSDSPRPACGLVTTRRKSTLFLGAARDTFLGGQKPALSRRPR